MSVGIFEKIVAEKWAWTAQGTAECISACAALGFMAVSVSDGGSENRYMCSGEAFGNRPGYQIPNAKFCYSERHCRIETYNCLCTDKNDNRFEWKAAPGSLPGVDVRRI